VFILLYFIFLSYGLLIVQADAQTDEVFAQMDLTPQLEVCLSLQVSPYFCFDAIWLALNV